MTVEIRVESQQKRVFACLVLLEVRTWVPDLQAELAQSLELCLGQRVAGGEARLVAELHRVQSQVLLRRCHEGQHRPGERERFTTERERS